MPAPPFAQLSEPPSPITRMRLTSPAEILAAVPYLLGFAPERSLVVICLRGKEVSLTMRVDLDAAMELKEAFVERLLSAGSDHAVLIVFDPDPDEGPNRPGMSLMRSVMRAFQSAKVGVKDALGVGAGRYWSYLCTDAACCPPEGRAAPVVGSADHSRVAAPFVAIGTAPLASRLALEASICPVDGERRSEVNAALLVAVEQPSLYPIERWFEAVRRYRRIGKGRPVAIAEAARLIVGLRDPAVRDEVLSWTAGPSLASVLAVLGHLAPLALAPFDAQVLSALGWAAFASGDGALASVALERALRSDPSHSMAGMLAAALDGGVTPMQLNEISRGLGGLLEANGSGPV